MATEALAQDRGVMTVLVRALGIGLAATAAYLVMTLGGTDRGDANIGAGLAVFAVLAVGGFAWGLVDGLGRVGVGALVLRWALASVLAVATVVAAMAVRSGWDRLDLDASSVVFLGLLVLVPSVVGVLIGYAVRTATASSAPTRDLR